MLRAAPVIKKNDIYAELYRASNYLPSHSTSARLNRIAVLAKDEGEIVLAVAISHEILRVTLPWPFSEPRYGLDPLLPARLSLPAPTRLAILGDRVQAIAAHEDHLAAVAADGTAVLYKSGKLIRHIRGQAGDFSISLLPSKDASEPEPEPQVVLTDFTRGLVTLYTQGSLTALYPSPAPIVSSCIDGSEIVLATLGCRINRLAVTPVSAPPGGVRAAAPYTLQLVDQYNTVVQPVSLIAAPAPAPAAAAAAAAGVLHYAGSDRCVTTMSRGTISATWAHATKHAVEAVLAVDGALLAVGRAGDVVGGGAGGHGGSRHDVGFTGDAAWTAVAALDDVFVGVTAVGSLFVLTHASQLAATPVVLGQEGLARAKIENTN